MDAAKHSREDELRGDIAQLKVDIAEAKAEKIEWKAKADAAGEEDKQERYMALYKDVLARLRELEGRLDRKEQELGEQGDGQKRSHKERVSGQMS